MSKPQQHQSSGQLFRTVRTYPLVSFLAPVYALFWTGDAYRWGRATRRWRRQLITSRLFVNVWLRQEWKVLSCDCWGNTAVAFDFAVRLQDNALQRTLCKLRLCPASTCLLPAATFPENLTSMSPLPLPSQPKMQTSTVCNIGCSDPPGAAVLSCCPSVIRAIHLTVPSAECKLSTLSSVFLRRMPNEVTSHCFWHAQEHLTGVGVLEAMAKVTSVSGPDVCGPSTQTSQVDIIVKALPMCYPNGLIVLHGSSAGAFVFHPCLPFRFLPKPQFSTMHGIRIMLYTECDQLGHFEACVPTPQQDLDPSAKVVLCGCSSFGFPPSMIGGGVALVAPHLQQTVRLARRVFLTSTPQCLLIAYQPHNRRPCLQKLRPKRLQIPSIPHLQQTIRLARGVFLTSALQCLLIA